MDKDILKGLADNPLLLNAVKEAVLEAFTFDYKIRPDVSNENLGSVTRAIVVGRDRVEEAFDKIARLKSIKDKPDLPNPAR